VGEEALELVKGQLAEGFTFTSAAPDDHISVEKFKEKLRASNVYSKI